MNATKNTLTVKCGNNVQAFLYAQIRNVSNLERNLYPAKTDAEVDAHVLRALEVDGQLAGLSPKVAAILARVALRNYRLDVEPHLAGQA